MTDLPSLTEVIDYKRLNNIAETMALAQVLSTGYIPMNNTSFILVLELDFLNEFSAGLYPNHTFKSAAEKYISKIEKQLLHNN